MTAPAMELMPIVFVIFLAAAMGGFVGSVFANWSKE